MAAMKTRKSPVLLAVSAFAIAFGSLVLAPAASADGCVGSVPIGKTVSSGCFGMLNEDVTDLFDRAKVGTRVVVLPGNPPPSSPAIPAPASRSGQES